MMADATIYAAAQWLSEHSRACMLLLALVAFVLEFCAQKSQQRATTNPAPHWLPTWRTNGVLFAVSFLMFALLAPWIEPIFQQLLSGRTGLFTLADWPLVLRLVCGFVLLDFAGYWLHRAAHHFGWWWRLHQVHHSDISYNASTHFRQHPLAMLLAFTLHALLLWLLGIPVVSWVIYAAAANVHQLWQHMSLTAPAWLDRALRPVMVTQRFHRLHHHPERAMNDRNFGILLPWWDQLFGTAHDASHYPDTDRAHSGHRADSPTGVAGISSARAVSALACLAAPFMRVAAAAPVKSSPLSKKTRLARRRTSA
jgi:sterol desaturase/sphingolipid hydroxylase (fatty acid hydroxylase superfamily)